MDLNESIEWIRQRAGETKFLCSVKQNAMFATMVYYDLPWLRDAPITDLMDINKKYRAMGVIQ